MKVSSPIGELPFEPRALRYHDRGLQIEGVMGAWPAQVHIGLSDIPAALRLIAKPAAFLAGSATAILGLAYLAGPRRHRH